MTKIKRLSVAAGLGAALAVALAGPAAASGSHVYDDPTNRDVMFVVGQDQYCNAQGVIVIIQNSCNGNGNNDSDGNGDVED